MIFTIRKNTHRARPYKFGRLWFNKKQFVWSVKFDPSCAYMLKSGDQWDYNKLCGFGFLWNVHGNSARFGWRYNIGSQRMEVAAYWYVNGKRNSHPLVDCELGKEYILMLNHTSREYYFEISHKGEHINSFSVPHYHNKKIKYRLGVFFGGNNRSPKEMKIELKNL